jgi:hypothetical protein
MNDFDHERLDVYVAAIDFVAWSTRSSSTCHAGVLTLPTSFNGQPRRSR